MLANEDNIYGTEWTYEPLPQDGKVYYWRIRARMMEMPLLEGEGEVSTEGEGEIPAEGELQHEGEIEGELPPEGEPSIEGEGEVPTEGESMEGEGETPADGEEEGELQVEGENEGESGVEDNSCGCCGGDTKGMTFKKLIERTFADWLLLGLCLASLHWDIKRKDKALYIDIRFDTLLVPGKGDVA